MGSQASRLPVPYENLEDDWLNKIPKEALTSVRALEAWLAQGNEIPWETPPNGMGRDLSTGPGVVDPMTGLSRPIAQPGQPGSSTPPMGNTGGDLSTGPGVVDPATGQTRPPAQPGQPGGSVIPPPQNGPAPVEPGAGLDWNYYPGEGATWNIDGASGNREFYARQFNNLLGETHYNRQQQLAAALRAENQAAPEQPQNDWSWAFDGQGLPQVQVAQGPIGDEGGGYAYQLREGITPGVSTNKQITDILAGQGFLDNRSKELFEQHWGKDNVEGASKVDWSLASTPQGLAQRISDSVSPNWGTALNEVFNNMFIRNDLAPSYGPKAAAGYALPVTWGGSNGAETA